MSAATKSTPVVFNVREMPSGRIYFDMTRGAPGQPLQVSVSPFGVFRCLANACLGASKALTCVHVQAARDHYAEHGAAMPAGAPVTVPDEADGFEPPF